jgi:hypothetical protein
VEMAIFYISIVGALNRFYIGYIGTEYISVYCASLRIIKKGSKNAAEISVFDISIAV